MNEFVGTYQTITLLWAGATAGAKQMTALARFRTETTALMALWAAVDFGEFLAIFGTFTPTAGLARFVTRRTLALRLREIVNVDDFRTDAGNDLLPVDCFYVAQVVIVEQSTAAVQDI